MISCVEVRQEEEILCHNATLCIKIWRTLYSMKVQEQYLIKVVEKESLTLHVTSSGKAVSGVLMLTHTEYTQPYWPMPGKAAGALLTEKGVCCSPGCCTNGHRQHS